MPRILPILSLVLVGIVSQGMAQQPRYQRRVGPAELPEAVDPMLHGRPGMRAPGQGDLAPLPPAQYYGRPKDLVHRNAALKAAQRRERIAARKAMGYSPLRPPASPVPIMGGHSMWSIIRPPLHIPSPFIGAAQPTVVIGGPTGLGGY